VSDPAFSRFAARALANLVREYPNQPGHVLAGPADLVPTRALHPAFYGSYDWHSAVHMHWLLARLVRAAPTLPERAAIVELFERHCTPKAIAGECAYFARPHTQSFERTYGWAWLLALAAELAQSDDARLRHCGANVAPLAAIVVARYHAYLPRARHPIRHGVHANSAFGLALALDYARVAGDVAFAGLLTATARAWYGSDRNAPAAWEPSGADFLSPALMEADLMRRVLAAGEFARWLGDFLPGLADGLPATLMTPVPVADRADPQLVHLDGLNLSRAWCMRGIAAALAGDDPRVPVLSAAAAAHSAAGMEGLESGEYVGEHWLATFAVLALAPVKTT
jgi:hypothetical protein